MNGNVHHNTTIEQRELLTRCGFLRIDGLKIVSGVGEGNVVETRDLSHLGSLTQNNGTWGLTTDGGEIWMSRKALDNIDIHHLRQMFARDNRTGFVWCSNGEKLDVNDVFERIADPDSAPKH